MRLLYTNFHQNDGGGHVTYIRHLAAALSARHDITIATPATSRLYRYAHALPGVHVHAQVYTSRLGPMMAELRQLRALLAEQQFDLIHVNGSADHRHIMLACLGTRRRPPIVWTKHNDHPVHSVGNRLRARLACDHVIAVSDYVRRMVDQSAYGRLPVTTIRHGIDMRYFAPPGPAEKAAARERLLGSGHEHLIVLGSSAGTNTDKGWLDLLAGLARLAPAQRARFRVLVAGSLPGPEKCAQVRALGLADQVIFPGLIDDVRPVLAACDVGFVLSWREALSYACREAMALGLPVLVSDAGGLPENLKHGEQGWVVPARDVQAISEVLGAIAGATVALDEMGCSARATAEHEFGLGRFVDRTCAVYEAVLPGAIIRA